MITNRITGQEPTEHELKLIQARAMEIYVSPYSSPEQLDWAISVYPEGFAKVYDLQREIYQERP